MSVGPLGFVGSAAGLSGAQRQHDTARAQNDSAAETRRTQNLQAAEKAAGIAPTDGEDTQSHERDADGRRLWEETGDGSKAQGDGNQPPADTLSKDPTGDCGSNLDLAG